MSLKRTKVITSYTGLARWISEVSEGNRAGYLARSQVADIPSPYHHSPIVEVWEHNGKRNIWFETRHRRYEVFEVPADMPLFKTHRAAEARYISDTKAA